MNGDVVDWLTTKAQSRVVVFRSSMLDEDECRRDGSVRGTEVDGWYAMCSDNVSIEQRLEVVVRMLVDVLWQKDGINIG